MTKINMSKAEWARLKMKIQRKYNHLKEEDLFYQEGLEEELITRLMNRLHCERDYLIFIFKKGLAQIDSNRL